MKTNIYFYQNNAYNAIVFDQENGCYILVEGDRRGYFDSVDLYAENAADQFRRYYADAIAADIMDLSGCCYSDLIYAGDFSADEFEESAELLATFDSSDNIREYANALGITEEDD